MKDRENKSATLAKAIRIIIIADLTMSLDNVLGVAGAAGGNMFLLLFGLGVKYSHRHLYQQPHLHPDGQVPDYHCPWCGDSRSGRR